LYYRPQYSISGHSRDVYLAMARFTSPGGQKSMSRNVFRLSQSRNRKAVETSNFVEIWRWTRSKVEV